MAGDSAKHALRRQLLLAPAMDSFVRAVRVKEGFLSSAQVVTHKPMNKHNQLMHSLGKAMLEMGLIGARQSRAVAWSTFSQSVAAEAQKRWEKHLHHGQSEKVATPIVDFRPSHWRDSSGQRQYQFLAVRLHPCGKIVPALLERAWSVHRKGSKSMTVEADCPLPSESCAKVHIVPLEKTSSGGYWVHGQLRSLSINPHHEDGIILYELPAQSVQVREGNVYLTVMIAKSCKDGWTEMDGSGWTVANNCGQPSSRPSVSSGQPMTVFTYDCFQPNKTGRANICAYMEVMKSMYERLLGRSLCDADGKVSLPRRIFEGRPPIWPVLVARTPGYFDAISASKKHSGGQYSNAVWTRFNSVAPVSDAGQFMQFLKDVHAVSLNALPV